MRSARPTQPPQAKQAKQAKETNRSTSSLKELPRSRAHGAEPKLSLASFPLAAAPRGVLWGFQLVPTLCL